MALFGRDDKDSGTGRREAPEAVPTNDSRKESTAVETTKTQTGNPGGVTAYLGKGSRVTGKLRFDGTVRVDGQVEGEVAADDTLVVGESAVINAQISGSTVVIQGKVTGDINARTRVEIRAPGKLYGNIVTPSLVIHEGVLFEGHCSMGGAEAKHGDKKVSPFPKEEKSGEGSLGKVSTEASR